VEVNGTFYFILLLLAKRVLQWIGIAVMLPSHVFHSLSLHDTPQIALLILLGYFYSSHKSKRKIGVQHLLFEDFSFYLLFCLSSEELKNTFTS
jgi:hypothetical protein